jgi:hypothetical protein
MHVTACGTQNHRMICYCQDMPSPADPGFHLATSSIGSLFRLSDDKPRRRGRIVLEGPGKQCARQGVCMRGLECFEHNGRKSAVTRLPAQFVVGQVARTWHLMATESHQSDLEAAIGSKPCQMRKLGSISGMYRLMVGRRGTALLWWACHGGSMSGGSTTVQTM